MCFLNVGSDIVSDRQPIYHGPTSIVPSRTSEPCNGVPNRKLLASSTRPRERCTLRCGSWGFCSSPRTRRHRLPPESGCVKISSNLVHSALSSSCCFQAPRWPCSSTAGNHKPTSLYPPSPAAWPVSRTEQLALGHWRSLLSNCFLAPSWPHAIHSVPLKLAWAETWIPHVDVVHIVRVHDPGQGWRARGYGVLSCYSRISGTPPDVAVAVVDVHHEV